MFGRKQKGYTIVELVIVLVWLFGALASLAFVAFICWAIYKLVMHFTVDPVATAMVGNALSYLS